MFIIISKKWNIDIFLKKCYNNFGEKMDNLSQEIINRVNYSLNNMKTYDHLLLVKSLKMVTNVDDDNVVLWNYLLADSNYKRKLAKKIIREENINFNDIIFLIGLSDLLIIIGDNLQELINTNHDNVQKLFQIIIEKDASSFLAFFLNHQSFYPIFKEELHKMHCSLFNIESYIINAFLSLDRDFVFNHVIIDCDNYIRLIKSNGLIDMDLKDLIIYYCDNPDYLVIIKEYIKNNSNRMAILFNLMNVNEVKKLLNNHIQFDEESLLNIDLYHINIRNYLLLGKKFKKELSDKIINIAKKYDIGKIMDSILEIDGNLEGMLELFGDESINDLIDNNRKIIEIIFCCMIDKDINFVLKYALSNIEFYKALVSLSSSFKISMRNMDYSIVQEFLKRDFYYTITVFQLSSQDFQKIIN